MKRILVIAAATLLAAGCSGEKQSIRTPTAATGIADGMALGSKGSEKTIDRSVSLPATPGTAKLVVALAIDFPPRDQALDFRRQLESTYQFSLSRTPAGTYVDAEGSIIWTLEYLRYRINSCSHFEAVRLVTDQLNGRPALQGCGNGPSTGSSVNFPPRNESLEFRQQLEVLYRDQLRRPLGSSYVDLEGDVVWTQEYARYRIGGCSHADALTKVLAAVNGRGSAPVCQPVEPPQLCGGVRPGNCDFRVSQTYFNAPDIGGVYDIVVDGEARASCTWAVTDVPSWITLLEPTGEVCSSVKRARFSMGSNPQPTLRIGYFVVAGKRIEIAQAPSVTGTLVTTEIIGSGDGWVRSTPAGISCSGMGVTCYDRIPAGTRLVLTADPGARLHFWGGACQMIGVISGNTCTLTIGNSALTIQADFVK